MVLLLPFSFGCETGLQGKVTITITYLDGSTKTISGHRRFGEGSDKESIFYKMSQNIGYSTDQVGKKVVYKHKDTNRTFDSEEVYQYDNGKRIHLVQSLENKRYKIHYFASFPGYTFTQTYDKFYSFGDKIELIPEIVNLTNFDSSLTNYDRYSLSGWEIYYKSENDKELSIPMVFGGTFDETFDAYFEQTKVKGEYEYQMQIKAVFKPDTYIAKLHFEHNGVKPLNEHISPIELEQTFNATYFNRYDFTQYVKEENIMFFNWSTDMYSYIEAPKTIDKSLNGEVLNLYARWSYYKIITIDFLDGKGPVDCYVFDDAFQSTYYLYPSVLSEHLASEQIKNLVGFSENRDGTSRIIDLYEIGDENTIYYPVIL